MNALQRLIRGLVPIVLLLLAGESSSAKEIKGALRVEMTLSGGAWQIKSLPGQDDVLADADPKLRDDLKKAVEAVRTEFGDDPTDLSFTDLRLAVRNQMQPKYVGFLLQPPPPGSPASGVFVLDAFYEEPAAPVHIHKRLKISVLVRGSRALAANPVLTTVGELEARNIPGIPRLSGEDRSTPVLVAASEEGLAYASAWGDSSDHAAAFEIAAFALASAQKHDLQGSDSDAAGGAPTDAFGKVITDIENHVTKRFDLPGWQVFPPDGEGVRIKAVPGENEPWKIVVNVQAVEAVKFHVQAIRIEGQTKPVESYPQSAAKIARLEEKVAGKQRALFDSLSERLVTKEQFAHDTKTVLDNIEREEKLVDAGVETAGRAIVFTALYQPRVTDLKAGLGYSTDKQLAGNISLTSQNAFGDDSLLKFLYTAGLEKQEGEFSYARPFFHRRDSPFTSNLDITGRYLRDDDQKLGMPASVGFDEEQYSIVIGHTLEFRRAIVDRELDPDSATTEPAPNHSYFAKVSTSAGLSDTRLGAPAELKSQAESGQVLFLVSDLEQQWNRKLRLQSEPGIGATHLVWNVHLKKGFEAGPGDFDFLAGQTAATATVYFGDTSSRDFLVRLTVGGAVVIGNSPLFEEFRLGGDSTVRGLEYGERVARGAVYQTLQGGISVERLVTGISPVTKKEKPQTPAAKESGPGQGGLDLKSIFVNLFFDYAYVTRRGSRDPNGSRSLEAVGVSLEMRLPESARNGSLEFGYAWSPDSIHDRGRIFTSARFDLF
jgi:hypothetical protein